MGDISLRTILSRAKRLQRDHYSEDALLESHLAQGLIRNAASLIDPDWSIGFMDMGRESITSPRDKIMSAVDCLLYAASILSIQNIDSRTTLRIVSDRQKMVRAMHDTAVAFKKAPTDQYVAVLDIDGVIFPYPSLWNRFKEAHLHTGKEVSEIKEMYRLSGLKASEPPLPGAGPLIKYLQDNECIVILLSSRPVNLYPEIYMQTVSFLKRYDINPDFLFFKDHKHISAELVNLWKRVVFFIDDEKVHLAEVKSNHPNVCCIHITDGSPEKTADYHFGSTELFYNKLVSDNTLQNRYQLPLN